MVETIVALAHGMGAQIVAEGVVQSADLGRLQGGGLRSQARDS